MHSQSDQSDRWQLGMSWQWPRLLIGLVTLFLGLALTLALTACIHSPAQEKTLYERGWTGRLMVESQSTDESLAGAPPATRTTHAHFEWTGDIQTGRLDLLTPLGQVVARAHWSSQGAWLWTSEQTASKGMSFPSLDALIEETLGVPIPVEGLMAWLETRHWPSMSVAASAVTWQVVRMQNEPPSLELSYAQSQPDRRYRVRLVLDEQ